MSLSTVLTVLIAFIFRLSIAQDTPVYQVLINKYQWQNNASQLYLGIDTEGAIWTYGLNDTDSSYYAACIWQINATGAADQEYRLYAAIDGNNFLAVEQTSSNYTPYQLAPGESGNWVGVPRGSWDIWTYQSDDAIALHNSDIDMFLSINDDGAAIMSPWDNTTEGNPRMIWYPRIGMELFEVTRTITKVSTAIEAATTVSADGPVTTETSMDVVTVTATVSTTAGAAAPRAVEKRNGPPTLTSTRTIYTTVFRDITQSLNTYTISGNLSTASTVATSTYTTDLVVTVTGGSASGASATSSSTATSTGAAHVVGGQTFGALGGLFGLLGFVLGWL